MVWCGVLPVSPYEGAERWVGCVCDCMVWGVLRCVVWYGVVSGGVGDVV